MIAWMDMRQFFRVQKLLAKSMKTLTFEVF